MLDSDGDGSDDEEAPTAGVYLTVQNVTDWANGAVLHRLFEHFCVQAVLII